MLFHQSFERYLRENESRMILGVNGWTLPTLYRGWVVNAASSGDWMGDKDILDKEKLIRICWYFKIYLLWRLAKGVFFKKNKIIFKSIFGHAGKILQNKGKKRKEKAWVCTITFLFLSFIIFLCSHYWN